MIFLIKYFTKIVPDLHRPRVEVEFYKNDFKKKKKIQTIFVYQYLTLGFLLLSTHFFNIRIYVKTPFYHCFIYYDQSIIPEYKCHVIFA